MYRQIIILFLFYLGAAALSPVFGEVASELEKSNIQMLIGEDGDEETSIKIPVKSFHGDKSVGAPPIITFTHHESFVIQARKYSVESQHLLSYRITQRPLFLLYHSFLFYDLL